MNQPLKKTAPQSWDLDAENSRVKMLLGVLSIGMVFIAVQAVDYYTKGYILSFYNQIVLLTLLSCSFLPSMRKKKALNINLILVAGNASILIDTFLLGKEIGQEYYMFPLLICPLILLDLKNWLVIAVASGWTILTNIIIASLPQLPPVYILEAPHEYKSLNLVFAVVLTAAQGHLIFLASRKLLQDKSLLIEKLKEEYNENVRINKLMVEQQRTAELGLMAGGIAHEIRNPLAVIRGQTELIQNITHTDKFGPEVILKKSESIRNATQRIATIIDGMSVLGRKSDLDAYVKCNVAEIASYLEATCGSQFLVKGIEFHVQIDKNLPEIECRKGQIAQILLNLINNATYELSQTEGRRWIVLEFKDAGEQIEASVLDSGGGVKLEDRDKIFQAFYTTKQLGQGTGLGLSISKAIAQDHGGSLTLDTQSQYTRFVLKLPKSQIQLAVA